MSSQFHHFVYRDDHAFRDLIHLDVTWAELKPFSRLAMCATWIDKKYSLKTFSSSKAKLSLRKSFFKIVFYLFKHVALGSQSSRKMPTYS